MSFEFYSIGLTDVVFWLLWEWTHTFCTHFGMHWDCLQSDFSFRKRKQVVSEQLSHYRIQCIMGGKKGRKIEARVRAGFYGRFPRLTYIRGGRYERPVLKRDGCLQSLPICLTELSDSPTLRQRSENSQRDVDFHKHMIRWTKWSRGRTRDLGWEADDVSLAEM